ncbi:MAG: energy transducer TonB [Bacteroidetes bacterium]|nr:energy transducer TonB [Bacteroidota bacterium]
MKKYLIILVCLILSLMVFGQKETKNLMVDIEEVEVTPPKFTGIENVAATLETDNSSLVSKYLNKNLIYPERAPQFHWEGTEIVQFTVTQEGELTNFKVINGVCREIDKEVIRVLKTTDGMWKPGYNNGVPTAMEQEVSVRFGLGDYKDGAIINHFVKEATNFFKKGSENLLVEHKPKKALKSYNKGVRYLPNDKALLLGRGMCHYELGDKESAKKDWNRIVTLGGINQLEIDNDLVGMKGYSEMTNILAQKQKKE